MFGDPRGRFAMRSMYSREHHDVAIDRDGHVQLLHTVRDRLVKRLCREMLIAIGTR
ncbi:MAG: hypothetical protein Q7S58_02795 [Candidatus Binatus sp.]|nr:hypothetical protein [Candidatus Binatus sp.]